MSLGEFGGRFDLTDGLDDVIVLDLLDVVVEIPRTMTEEKTNP